MSTMLLLVVRLLSAPAAAQVAGPTHPHNAGPASTRTSVIAVIDLVKVFDQHPYFKANLATTQQQVHEFELQLAAQKKEISERSRHLNELSTDSAEYRRLETELARKIATLRSWARRRQRQLTRQQATQYYAAYQDILTAVARVARRKQVVLVLRTSTNAGGSADARSLVRRMNRPIVMQRNLDITQQVIDELRTATAQLEPSSSSPPTSR